MSKLTRAAFLQDPKVKTPVFVRFSTVAGGAGSGDTPRDVRGFAVKFYTSEGNFDLVGNNIPVFFIQDAIKFPDLIHAVKMEPDRGFPQAASAHDTFWDFVTLMPESMHMLMWAMSDRTIPRSFRMMEGFGVHTFRFVNAAGKSTFVKFHWRPKIGAASLIWDESVKLYGADPDSQRRDLFDAIAMGIFRSSSFPCRRSTKRWRRKFPFDILDATKIIPEEMVPLQPLGRLVLDRNPDNFFAETEQVAFHPGHVVPGIDFTDDPLLQGRLFSYTDTQLIRLGGANFHETADQPAEMSDGEFPARRRQAHGHRQGTGRVRAEQHRARRPARRSRARVRIGSRARSRRKCARAIGDVCGSLQPAAAVLSLDVRARAAAHRQCLHVRAEQSVEAEHPAADARAPEEHRRAICARASKMASACRARRRTSSRRVPRST